MNLKDVLWLSLKGISERKVRTALTVLCVVIGIAAIVALVSLVSGISSSINNSLQSIGPSTIYIVPRGQAIFTDADVAEIETLPNVSAVIPMLRFNANMSIDGVSTSTAVIGVDNYSIAQAVGGVNLYEGTVYNDSQAPTALVGHDIAFPTSSGSKTSQITLNEPIFLTLEQGRSAQTITLVPVGILQTYGSSLFISPDSSIFIPLSEAESLLTKYSYNVLLVKATNTTTVNGLYNLLTDIYGSTAEIISVQELTSTVSSITGTLSILLGGIAGISLIVAGISILSIMMVSVTERTHEIGILKAIGFKRKDVLLLFLSEALIIGIAGGVVGCVIGSAGAYALPAALSRLSTNSSGASTSAATTRSGFGGSGGSFGGSGGGAPGAVTFGGTSGTGASSSSSPASLAFSPQISPELIAGAILVAVIVSVIASLYPAWKASTTDPITALRTE